jgi:hypothetical protein
MDRFSTLCLLCIDSSDWVAKENECRDSVGKRVKSSPKGIVGEPGADGAEADGCLDTGGVIWRDAARWVEGTREPGGC